MHVFVSSVQGKPDQRRRIKEVRLTIFSKKNRIWERADFLKQLWCLTPLSGSSVVECVHIQRYPAFADVCEMFFSSPRTAVLHGSQPTRRRRGRSAGRTGSRWLPVAGCLATAGQESRMLLQDSALFSFLVSVCMCQQILTEVNYLWLHTHTHTLLWFISLGMVLSMWRHLLRQGCNRKGRIPARRSLKLNHLR